MNFELLQGPTGRVRFTLDEGTFTVGGDPGDDVPVPDSPPGLLQLWIERDGFCVVATHPVRIGPVELQPFVRRRVLSGERVTLASGTELWCPEPFESPPSPAPGSTRSVALALLGGAGETFVAAPSLRCLTGLDLDRIFPLGAEAMVIGRANDSDIRLRDRAVSRQHARVVPSAQGHTVESLGGTNAVAVNGGALDEARPLQDGDIVSLGFSQLRYCLPRASLSVPNEERRPLESAVSEDLERADSDAGPRVHEEMDALRSQPGGEWPWMAAGATLVAIGTCLGVALS